MAQKLYTEEQVKKAFYDGIFFAVSAQFATTLEHNKYFEGVINSLTPIELPSDEKIIYKCFQNDSYELATDGDSVLKIYSDGYKAALGQIINQNK